MRGLNKYRLKRSEEFWPPAGHPDYSPNGYVTEVYAAGALVELVRTYRGDLPTLRDTVIRSSNGWIALVSINDLVELHPLERLAEQAE